MKKLSVMIASLLCLSLLTGCTHRTEAPVSSEAPAAVSTEAPASAAEPTEAPIPEPTSAPERFFCTVDGVRDDVYDEEGNLLLSFRSNHAAVTMPGRESAAGVINAALQSDEDLFRAGTGEEDMPMGREAVAELAREDRALAAEGGGDWVCFALERTLSVMRMDENVVSLACTEYSDLGGVHGNYGTYGRVFDARTGEKLTVRDLSDDAAFADWCAEQIIARTKSGTYEEQGFYEDYESYIPAIVASDTWYFSPEGLVFVAQPYVIAPYAAGQLEFTLPYADLAGRLKAAYFPAGNVHGGDGALTGSIEDEPGEYTLLMDDATGGEGARVVFRARGSVTDVWVEHVTYSECDNTFYSRDHALYASALEDGESLCILTWIPDVLPTLRLTYTGADGTVSRLISQSGEDGSLILTE